jgi:Uma2 family endonuclease
MAMQELTPTRTRTKKQTDRWYPPPQGKWTYADYLHLPDDHMRYEIIGGNLYMSPAPRPKHQEIIISLIVILHGYLNKHQSGKLYHAPIDLLLPGIAQPVQPDILVISSDRLDMIKETNIEGTPVLIMEVLSPGNPQHDKDTKFHAYAQAGVKEYWLVNGAAQVVDVFVLRGQAYAPLGHFTADDKAFSEALPGFKVRASEICS